VAVFHCLVWDELLNSRLHNWPQKQNRNSSCGAQHKTISICIDHQCDGRTDGQNCNSSSILGTAQLLRRNQIFYRKKYYVRNFSEMV